MKKGKNILAVGVAGALLLSISGAVSPLNNTFAVGDTTAMNTDQDLQKAKEEAIKKLDDFTNAFNEKLYRKALADAMKGKYKEQINEANSVEKINSIINTVKTADEIGKAKEEGRQKVDKMTNLSQEQKVEAYNSIGSGATAEKVKESENSAKELDKADKDLKPIIEKNSKILSKKQQF